MVVDGSVVGRVVRGVVAAGAVVLSVGAGRPEVAVDTALVEGVPVEVVPGTGRGVVSTAVLADPAVGLPAAEVGVSGSRVRDAVVGPVDPSAGTVTSGTAGAGRTVIEPLGVVPKTGPLPDRGTAPDVVGEA